MAEVATKKSINVVSSKKNEVCGVQSNNGLIDLDNLTASNKQLITLCDNNDDDDDLVLTNNTRNELGGDDKSLQELIESELALRICANDDEVVVDAEESEEIVAQPETIKRIVLDRRQDTLDVNTEFIAAESGHYSLIEEPYGHQNGHASPRASADSVKPEPVHFRNEEEEQVFVEQPALDDDANTLVQKTSDDDQTNGPGDEPRVDRGDDGNEDANYQTNVKDAAAPPSADEPDSGDVARDLVAGDSIQPREQPFPTPSTTCPDKHQQEEEVAHRIPADAVLLRTDTDQARKNADVVPDTWTEQAALADGQQAGQFSDNFDETLYQQDRTVEQQKSLGESAAGEHIDKADDSYGHAAAAAATSAEDESLSTGRAQNEEERVAASLISQDETSVSGTIERAGSEPSEKREIDPARCVQPPTREQPASYNDDDDANNQFEAASTQEFLDTERRVLSEEMNRETPQIVVSSEIDQPSQITSGPISENGSSAECTKDVAAEDPPNPIGDESSCEGPFDATFIEKTEVVVVSDTSVTIVSEAKQIGPTENLDSWTTVEEATKPASSHDEVRKDGTVASAGVNEATRDNNERQRQDDSSSFAFPRAPLATPDDETSDISNACYNESREETVTSSSTTVTSSKGGTKTKKKKIEGVAGNDATSPNLTPRTKKTKKSKKSDLEKENISVNCQNYSLRDASMHTGSRRAHSEMIDFSDEDDLSNVNVKSLTQNYVSETSRSDQEKSCRERIATGVSIKQLCRSFGDISNMSDGDQAAFGKTNRAMETEEKARSMGDLRVCEQGYAKYAKEAPVFARVSVKALRASYCSLASLTSEGKDKDQACERPRHEKSSFNKFDALTKKTILHVRSVDAGKVQQQLNAVGQNGDANSNCRSCGKVVFQMEQTKAEGLVWHKNCFRCVQCSKQLNVDNYESHESTLYCKPHFKELFQPKPVEESDQPASDKPDLGLEELSSLNVKSRFQVFEKASTDNTNEIEKSPSQIAVKRSPSILSKLAKFQAKGMDIGVADESLNGIPYEESSESENEEETEETEEVETEIVKAKRTTRERPISFSKMDDMKSRWESTSQQGRREVQREARKEEIAGIRSRLFMGKQGKMKEMYQQAVAGSDRVTKINAAEEIQHSTHARSIKERFERGEPLGGSDDETDNKPKPEKADEEVIAAGIGRKSRSLFLELDASVAKTGRPVTPVHPKTPTETSRRARDMNSPDREIYRDPDVVRADDRVDEVVHTDTARKMLSIFRQMEENATKEELPEGPKPLKRFTPPPEDKFAKATASDSEEDEDEEGEESEGDDSNEERDPNYVRASDKVEDEFLKQAQNAARAKTLRAKFEHWEETDGKVSNHHIAEMEMAQGTGEQSSIESASSLRARFESLGSQTNESPRAPKVKVNRFV